MRTLLFLLTFLLSACASEPTLGQFYYHSATASAEELDSAAGKAAAELGYIPVNHAIVGNYRTRAVAEGDARWVKAEKRSRAQVLWIHIIPATTQGLSLRLDVLCRKDIWENIRLADEFESALKEQIPDLRGKGTSACTGLGYDPFQPVMPLTLP